MPRLSLLVVALSLIAILPAAFAGGNNTSVTAAISGGSGNPLIVDITVADPDGLSHVIISSNSAAGSEIRVTDPLPTCPTSVTYRLDRGSADETYDVGALDCENPAQASTTYINADGSSEPTQYTSGPVVGAPALRPSKLELLLPYIGSAVAVVAGAAVITYVARSKRNEPKD